VQTRHTGVEPWKRGAKQSEPGSPSNYFAVKDTTEQQKKAEKKQGEPPATK